MTADSGPRGIIHIRNPERHYTPGVNDHERQVPMTTNSQGTAGEARERRERLAQRANEEAAELARPCECPTPDVFHYKGCAVLIERFEANTADGVKIRDGMAVWDYNLEPGFVSLASLGDDGWFMVCKPGQNRGSWMNDVRVCVRHPSTGQAAGDAIRASGAAS